MSRRLAPVLLAASLTVLIGGQSATADPAGNGIGTRLEDDSAELELSWPWAGPPSGSAGGTTAPANELSYRYTSVPACVGNDPSIENADVFCQEAATMCPQGELMYWLYRSEDVEPRAWTRAGQRCQGEREPSDPRPEIPGFTLADFQRLPLPAGTPNVEPSNGYTLVGVPTNVYAAAEPVTLDTDLLGFPVQVRATPSRYAWDFGDGNTHGPTEDAGAPYPDLRITHEYASSGVHGVQLTTYYSGEYSVAGGPWLPVPGEAEVTSGAVDVEALAGRNRLVAEAGG